MDNLSAVAEKNQRGEVSEAKRDVPDVARVSRGEKDKASGDLYGLTGAGHRYTRSKGLERFIRHCGWAMQHNQHNLNNTPQRVKNASDE